MANGEVWRRYSRVILVHAVRTADELSYRERIQACLQQPGDPILIARQAAGFFTLNELPDAGVLWMLSTGTAIGPFLSILANGEVWRRYPRIVLVHAAIPSLGAFSSNSSDCINTASKRSSIPRPVLAEM